MRARAAAVSAALVVSLLTAPVAPAEDARAPGPPHAEDPGTSQGLDADDLSLRFSLDPYFSLETGADLTYACAFSLGELEASYFPALAHRPAAGALARLARAVVLDAPLAWWFAVLQHEAFGHGGRAREFGADAGFHMGSPWESRSSYASFEAEGLTAAELLRVYAGGSESNSWSATLLERELVAGRPLTAFELLHLAGSRLVVSDYVLRTTPDPEQDPAGFHREWSGGGDVANYLGYLNTVYYGEAGIEPTVVSPSVVREYRRLERQARWSLLDPGVWMAAWAAGRQIARGDEAAVLPVPRAGRWRWLPLLSADWMPDGGAVAVETVFAPVRDSGEGSRWFSFTARRGSGPAGSYGAVGAAAERLWSTRRFRIGGELELWDGSDRGFGGGIRARLRATRGRLAGFFLDVGAKSDGHWPGRPAEPGLFLRIGGYLGPMRRADTGPAARKASGREGRR